MLLQYSCIITISISLLFSGCSTKNTNSSDNEQASQISSDFTTSADESTKQSPVETKSVAINKSIFINQDILKDTTLVSTFNTINKLILSKPKQEYKIAVLIPLSGDYQNIGRQVRDGILKLYFNDNLDMQISFFDSLDGKANLSYQSIINSSFNIVIGHLLSQNIRKIEFSTKVVNVSLNEPPKQFSSPYNASINFKIDNQIEQLTQQALKEYFSKAIILVDNTAQGAALAEMLSDSWYKAGKDIIQVAFIGKTVNTINQQFSSLFRAKQDIRIYEADSKGNLSFKGNSKDDFPFIRQDVDVIFSFLSLEQSRYLIPALNLIGGISPTIYSSSKITRSQAFSSIADRDLQGISYLDIPWRYDNTGFKFFEAVGIDSLALAIQLWSADRFQYDGLTGKYLFNSQKIKKELNWYRFDNKKITTVN